MTSSYIWNPPPRPWMFMEHSIDEIYERVYAAIHAVVPIGMVFKRSTVNLQTISERMIIPDVGTVSKLVKIEFGSYHLSMDGDQYYMYSRCGRYYAYLQPCRFTSPVTQKLMDTKAVFFGYSENRGGVNRGVCMWSAYNSKELEDGLQQTRIEMAHMK